MVCGTPKKDIGTMWQLIGLSAIQSIMLSFGQLTLKLALARMPRFSWTGEFWLDLLTNWWLCSAASSSAAPRYCGCIS